MSKKRIIYGLLALLVLGLGIGTYQNHQHKSFNYVAKHQKIPTRQVFKDFENGKTNKMVVVLYRDSCPVCHKWQYKINDKLTSTNAPKAYIEVSNGLPDYFTDKIAEADYENIKTPYVYIFENKSFNPKFKKRVNTKNILNEMEEATK